MSARSGQGSWSICSVSLIADPPRILLSLAIESTIRLCSADAGGEDLMLARRFLWVVAGLTMLVMAAALVYRIFGAELMRFTMVPTAAFEGGPPAAPSAYADRRLWIARPDMPDSPGLWMPAGVQRQGI